MRFDQLAGVAATKEQTSLKHLEEYAKLPEFRTKVAQAQRQIEQFLSVCKRPIISCGGGKDGTAAALLARSIDPDIPIICAIPPNPLPKTPEHRKRLKESIGGAWLEVSYWWDVEAVLTNREPYPAGLKIKKLQEAIKDNDFDGVVMGVRMAESKGRTINGRIRGEVYKTKKDEWRCLPVLRWSAEETLALSLATNTPINPVYTQSLLSPNLEYLRDGTWWPHGYSATQGFGEWVKWYYPELYDKYRQAETVMDNTKSLICIY